MHVPVCAGAASCRIRAAAPGLCRAQGCTALCSCFFGRRRLEPVSVRSVRLWHSCRKIWASVHQPACPQLQICLGKHICAADEDTVFWPPKGCSFTWVHSGLTESSPLLICNHPATIWGSIYGPAMSYLLGCCFKGSVGFPGELSCSSRTTMEGQALRRGWGWAEMHLLRVGDAAQLRQGCVMTVENRRICHHQ